MKKFVAILIGFTTFLGCNIAPEPIDYGSDACHFCSMTIVDQQHAAQIVTEKGKVFKFDATECMLNHVKEVDNTTIALFLVNDYNAPGELIDATQATFLKSRGIPSPMGEFLTAFGNRKGVEKAKSEHGGELFTWPELTSNFGI